MKVIRRSRSEKLKVSRRSQMIPMRPENYFAKAYNKAEIWEGNYLAKTSAIRAPKDLE